MGVSLTRSRDVTRQPRTFGGFVSGLCRGGVAGLVSGMVIGAAFALLSANDANVFDAVVQLLTLEPSSGSSSDSLRTGGGSIAGLLRRRYTTVWPVAAGTTFLLAFGIGCALVAAGTERWGTGNLATYRCACEAGPGRLGPAPIGAASARKPRLTPAR